MRTPRTPFLGHAPIHAATLIDQNGKTVTFQAPTPIELEEIVAREIAAGMHVPGKNVKVEVDTCSD